MTLPRGMPRTTAWTLDSNAVGIPLSPLRTATQMFTALGDATRSLCLGLRDAPLRVAPQTVLALG